MSYESASSVFSQCAENVFKFLYIWLLMLVSMRTAVKLFIIKELFFVLENPLYIFKNKELQNDIV